MKTMRATIAATAALAAAGLVIASPAEAFAPISYVADCPGTAVSQQLVTQDWSNSIVSTTAWRDYSIGEIVPLGTNTPGTNGQVTYWPIQTSDTVRYDMTGAGNLNWFYHVDCQY
jgi:hypothetical protein